MVLVSVIVPIYNVEKYVAKCLNSLIKQNYTNFEVLCVDDGSPDNSKAIVKKYAEKDSRIKLIEKENGGYGSVLQYSINNIRTEYFLICDPDDWLESTALKNLYEFAESNNLDIAVGDMYGVYPEGNDYVKKYIHTFYDELRILPNRVYTDKNIIEKFSFGHVSPHAKLFRTEIVKNINFPFKVSYTDFVLYMLALDHANRVGYINKPLAFYLMDRPGNTRTDIRKSIIYDYCKVWDATLEQIDKNNPLLMDRLFEQLKFMLTEYTRVEIPDFKDPYGKSVLKRIYKFRKYKNNVKLLDKSLKEKIIYYGLMNKYTTNYFAKYYCKMKNKKMIYSEEKHNYGNICKKNI